jgi:hypothetical protein
MKTNAPTYRYGKTLHRLRRPGAPVTNPAPKSPRRKRRKHRARKPMPRVRYRNPRPQVIVRAYRYRGALELIGAPPLIPIEMDEPFTMADLMRTFGAPAWALRFDPLSGSRDNTRPRDRWSVGILAAPSSVRILCSFEMLPREVREWIIKHRLREQQEA